MSVGILGSQKTPIVTVEKDGSIVAYRLPDAYRDWVTNAMLMSLIDSDMNINTFPSDVEFGCIASENYYYPELL